MVLPRLKHVNPVSENVIADYPVAPGSTVRVRDEDWLVTSVEQTTDGYFVHALGLSELVRGTQATFSSALDHIEVQDPANTTVVPDNSPHFRGARVWLDSQLRKTPVPISDPALAVSDGALVDVLPYQRTAVAKAIDPDNLRPRILLADAVGLGKTIEIGLILSELIRRGRGERILVVTPRHVLEQMQFELWTRFAIPFIRLDSVGIQRIRQKLPANRNPFAYFRRVIVSIDTLKSDKYVAHLSKQRWDAVVIDESHNVTNTATQNNRLARLLARQSDALILASATPHNGDPKSFAELIRMLEPSAVAPDGTVDESQLTRLIIRRHRNSPDVASAVGTDWAERLEPENVLVPANPAEEAVAAELEQVWLWPPHGASPYSGKKGAQLFPWTLAKAFLSSPAALLETVDNRLAALRSGRSDDVGPLSSGPDVDADSVAETPDLPNGSQNGATEDGAWPSGSFDSERAALERLRELTTTNLTAGSAKYDQLVQVLRQANVGGSSPQRAVVFSERIATLRWLRDKLAKDLKLPANAVEILHGGLSDVEQQRIVESFKLASSPIRVLVTGDVASEGVNLHRQCHLLIHYDIPWSLIRIEQRNGRIDRYGQVHRPRIVTLLLDPQHTKHFGGDIRVLRGLVEREHHAHKALGDTASLMGKYTVRAEERALVDVLRGAKQVSEVVQTVAQVTDSATTAGLFARLFDNAAVAPTAPTAPVPTAPARSGLFASDAAFLDTALATIYPAPGAPLSKNGVDWDAHLAAGLARITPPPDLASRLDVLPQSYLQDRHVTQRLLLATTPAQGKVELAQAREGESTSAWPEAHYLSPLHPILDWAADRTLAELGRNQVFAVRGAVENPTVLLYGSLTNKRGLTLAAQFVTVAFPLPSLPLPTVHTSVSEALAALGIASVNAGAFPDPEDLQPYVRQAVEATSATLRDQVEAVRARASEQVARRLERAEQWQSAARELHPGRALSQRRDDIAQEAEVMAAMTPDRTLIRPLLLVLPQEDD